MTPEEIIPLQRRPVAHRRCSARGSAQGHADRSHRPGSQIGGGQWE